MRNFHLSECGEYLLQGSSTGWDNGVSPLSYSIVGFRDRARR